MTIDNRPLAQIVHEYIEKSPVGEPILTDEVTYYVIN